MKKTLIVLASLSVALGACSSSDGDDASSVTDPSSTDASDASDTAAGADSDDSGDGSDDEAAAGADSDDAGEGSDDEFCQKFMEFDSVENQPTTQEETIAAFDELIESAPDDIREDLETVRDAFSGFEDFDAAEADPEAVEEFLEVLGQPEVVEAGENLERYTVDVCGIESEPTVTAADVEIPELSIPDAVEE
ncbi:MAG: hypothetical protein ABJH68_20905 [Ilumatobacter sp.]|uniref:hypothetical protein n=1 Tax=Ilumatobacter sp. TaxID=1967498 RepID=UPI003297FF43